MLVSESIREGRAAGATVSLDTLIPKDHEIRRIDAAILWQERSAPIRECYSAERGRPASAPEMLLALALLRHIYKLDSLRGAVSEMHTNLVYRWFIGCPLDQPVPHFSTISANMLHRVPGEVFDEAFAMALSDIIEAGVLSADDVLYPSLFLKENGWYERLCSRFIPTRNQMSFSVPKEEKKPTEMENAGQIPFGI